MSSTDISDNAHPSNVGDSKEIDTSNPNTETANIRLSKYGKSFKVATPDGATKNPRPVSSGALLAEYEKANTEVDMTTNTLPTKAEKTPKGLSKSASTSALKSGKMKENVTIKERRGSANERPRCYITDDGQEMTSLLSFVRVKHQSTKRQISRDNQDEKDIDTKSKTVSEKDEDDFDDDDADNGDDSTTLKMDDDDDDNDTDDLVCKASILMWDALSVIISAIYGIVLMVFGVVIPITEPFYGKPNPYLFEMFYIYLYVVSLLFFLFVHVILLNKIPAFVVNTCIRVFRFNRRNSYTVDHTSSLSSDIAPKRTDESEAETDDKSEDKDKDDSLPYVVFCKADQYTGSFMLRVGAVCFGVASMIHSGLYFGQYFQVYDGSEFCHHPIQAIKPFLHLVFTFVQVHFIFVNSGMHILSFRPVVRIGYAHLFSTNICVWLRCVVIETLQALSRNEAIDGNHVFSSWLSFRQSFKQMINNVNQSNPIFFPEISCYWNGLFGKVVESAGPYLYPCMIEYSLICVGVIYVMMGNIRHPARDSSVDIRTQAEASARSSITKTSSSHINASRGLFMGILVTVAAIITTIAFYVLVDQKPMNSTAIVLVHLSETSMYILTTFAVIIAADRMKILRFYGNLNDGLEGTLTFVSFTGLFLFAISSVVAASFKTNSPSGVLNILANMFLILQASIQTVFITAAGRINAVTQDQVTRKPGREFVTFLILCNFSMWAMSTFETQMPEHNPLQMEFYGRLTWSILTHISVPLSIYFRFHSVVCLSNIWKFAWQMPPKD